MSIGTYAAQELTQHKRKLQYIERDTYTTQESKTAIKDCKFTMCEGLLEIGFSTRQRLQSLLAGDYGTGAQIHAQQIIGRVRANRCAQLMSLLCMLDNCAKSRHVRTAYNKLTTAEKDDVNALVLDVIEKEEGKGVTQ